MQLLKKRSRRSAWLCISGVTGLLAISWAVLQSDWLSFKNVLHVDFAEEGFASEITSSDGRRDVVLAPEEVLRFIPAQSSPEQASGVGLAARILGDFEVTASFQNRTNCRTESRSVGDLIMEARVTSPFDAVVTVEHFRLPNGEALVRSSETTFDEWKRPRRTVREARVQSPVERLRLSRQGSTLKVAYAGPDARFNTLGAMEFGYEGVNLTRLATATDRPDCAPDVVSKSLLIKADGLSDARWNQTAFGVTLASRDRILYVILIQVILILMLVVGNRVRSRIAPIAP